MGRVQRGDGSPLSAFNPCLFKALDFVHALNICNIFGQQAHPCGRQRLPFCPNIPPDRTGKKHNTRPMKRPQEAVVFFVAIPIEIFISLWYTIHTCGCSSSVELRLPKPIRWVRLPSSAPEKSTCSCKCFFQRNKSLAGFVKYGFAMGNAPRRVRGFIPLFLSYHALRPPAKITRPLYGAFIVSPARRAYDTGRRCCYGSGQNRKAYSFPAAKA